MPSHRPAREDAVVEPRGEPLARPLPESGGSGEVSTVVGVVGDPKSVVLSAENTNHKNTL